MILLDTHVLYWWISGNQSVLSATAKRLISTALRKGRKGEISISSISAWEIAMLVARHRLVLSMDVSTWLAKVEEISALEFVPVNNEIAVRSTELPEPFHKDPADRIIIATARMLGATLVTADEKILAFKQVKCAW
jgi:PIN domain nuclease of toxin-antitoxin system